MTGLSRAAGVIAISRGRRARGERGRSTSCRDGGRNGCEYTLDSWKYDRRRMGLRGDWWIEPRLLLLPREQKGMFSSLLGFLSYPLRYVSHAQRSRSLQHTMAAQRPDPINASACAGNS